MQKDLGGEAPPPSKLPIPPKLSSQSKVALSAKAEVKPLQPKPSTAPGLSLAKPAPEKPKTPTPPPISTGLAEEKPASSIYSKPPAPPLPPSPPSYPLTPPSPPSAKKPLLPLLEKKPKRTHLWLFLGLGATAVILIATLGFLLYNGEKEEPPVIPPQEVTPTPTLIPEIKTQTISLIEKSATEIKEKLLETVQSTTTNITINRIFFKVFENETEKALSLSELTNILNLNIPDELKKPSEQTYNLILCSTPANEETATSSTQAKERENRLAIILETTEPDKANDALRAWENTIAEDLEGLMLATPEAPATTDFQENLYKGAYIRYKNLPTPSLTIDYTVYKNLIIITTSRQSIYAAYDLLINQPLGT